jgi:hypothetical protein
MEAFDDRRLVFLVSQPRAGSTLLQRMLGVHPEVATGPEGWFMLHWAQALGDHGLRTDYGHDAWRDGFEAYCSEFGEGRATAVRALRAAASVLYGDALARAGRRLYLDKTPAYTRILPELGELFPGARFVRLLRNPLAVLSSTLATWTRGDWRRLRWARYDLLEAPRRLVGSRALLAGRALDVRFEDLVADPGAELRKICAFLGVEPRDEMVSYGRFAPPPGLPASAEEAQQGAWSKGDPIGVFRREQPDASAAERWRSLAADRQSLRFAHDYLDLLGQPLLAELGYDARRLRAELGAPPPPLGLISLLEGLDGRLAG